MSSNAHLYTWNVIKFQFPVFVILKMTMNRHWWGLIATTEFDKLIDYVRKVDKGRLRQTTDTGPNDRRSEDQTTQNY